MYQMTETEYKFAELIWEEEPIGSGGCAVRYFRRHRSA